MKRYDVLNWFVDNHGYARYLEIGIGNPNACFNRVRAKHKTSVDPNIGRHDPPRHYRLSSDEFFATTLPTFDIVFVDGLHVAGQVLRDVQHALHHLTPGGTIVLHDCMPHHEVHARDARLHPGPWHGTVWRAFAHLRATRSDLSMRCIAADHGLGVIRYGVQALYVGPYETFHDYVANSESILLPLSPALMPAVYAKTSENATHAH